MIKYMIGFLVCGFLNIYPTHAQNACDLSGARYQFLSCTADSPVIDSLNDATGTLKRAFDGTTFSFTSKNLTISNIHHTVVAKYETHLFDSCKLKVKIKSRTFEYFEDTFDDRAKMGSVLMHISNRPLFLKDNVLKIYMISRWDKAAILFFLKRSLNSSFKHFFRPESRPDANYRECCMMLNNSFSFLYGGLRAMRHRSSPESLVISKEVSIIPD